MATPTLESKAAPLELIRIPENVRELDRDHVDALARSIALQGMLVPVVVRPSGQGFELVAGFHRAAAASKLGLTEVPVVVRDRETEDADRAVENITRKQLNPYEPSGVALDASFGLSDDAIASGLRAIPGLAASCAVSGNTAATR